MNKNNLNPAEKASIETLEKIFNAIENNQSFRLEAGAGAGKTYSLIKALQFLIGKREDSLRRKNQKIACITFTNVAKEEIENRVDNNPVIYADTIHGFSWSLLNGFQKNMRDFIPNISDKWSERIENAGGLKNQVIKYDLGYPIVNDEEIYLHHNDVIKIMSHFLSIEKFRNLLTNRFPVIFIDEYQDTNSELAESILSNLINSDSSLLVGFFGDHWQKIYGSSSCGLIQDSNILEIGKNANFRSDKNIVHFLNRMRPELPQEVKDPSSEGEIEIFHTNNFSGERKTGSHWKDDLPDAEIKLCVNKVKEILTEKGWSAGQGNTKILMLTNNVLAEEQGYWNLARVFKNTDDFLKKNDHYIKFFIEVLEPVCRAFEKKEYGKMFSALNQKTIKLTSQQDKISWNKDLDKLLEIRSTGEISDVLELLVETKRPRLSPKVEEKESKFEVLKKQDEISDEDKSFFSRINKLKEVSYNEVIKLYDYIEQKTPFSTQHGVKGAEFDNVLVIAGRGWSQYNWDKYLTWVNDNEITLDNKDAFERNRNLFYVSCSRSKKRLAVLFTQKLSDSSMETLSNWFGEQNLHSIYN